MTTTVPAPAHLSVPSVAPPTVAGIRATISPILAELARSAREREAGRDYAFDEVRQLARSGLLLIGIPVADGGAGGSLREVVDGVIELARADSNVAQALRSSHLTAYQVRARPDLPNRNHVLERIKQGDLFAGTVNERNGGASGSVTATVRRDGEDYLLNGEKYYSTGGLYAQWFSSIAVDEEGEIVRFNVSTDRAGVELLDDFDAVGQRLSASGTTRFTDVRLNPDEFARAKDAKPAGNPWLATLAQLYLAAIEAGIAAAVFDDAVRFATQKARPIKHSSADRTVDDPYVRRVVGEIAARAHTARAAVLIGAEVLEAVNDLPHDQVSAAGASAAVTIAHTQFVAIESALKAAELLFDVGGGSATDRTYGFDRHWRNARTVANHNPRDWKLAAAGAYHLSGEEPPNNGLF